MKTIGEVIDELDRRIEAYTAQALNPDRLNTFRDNDLHRRAELMSVKLFLTGESDDTRNKS